MPRQPRIRGTRNPAANRRGFMAFIVRNMQFQMYFDPTTMTTFGLGQDSEPVQMERRPSRYGPRPDLRGWERKPESRREKIRRNREMDDEFRMRGLDRDLRARSEMKAQRRNNRNPESRRERLRRGMEMTVSRDFGKKSKRRDRR